MVPGKNQKKAKIKVVYKISGLSVLSILTLPHLILPIQGFGSCGFHSYKPTSTLISQSVLHHPTHTLIPQSTSQLTQQQQCQCYISLSCVFATFENKLHKITKIFEEVDSNKVGLMDGPTMSCEFCDKVHQIWPKFVLDSIVIVFNSSIFSPEGHPKCIQENVVPTIFSVSPSCPFSIQSHLICIRKPSNML